MIAKLFFKKAVKFEDDKRCRFNRAQHGKRLPVWEQILCALPSGVDFGVGRLGEMLMGFVCSGRLCLAIFVIFLLKQPSECSDSCFVIKA
ncbi:hypothetical protein AKG43_03955 [Neisseria sp. 74A18]|nr:hypothetical protein AKG43_03955 [Neisseria sp. 74A18]